MVNKKVGCKYEYTCQNGTKTWKSCIVLGIGTDGWSYIPFCFFHPRYSIIELLYNGEQSYLKGKAKHTHCYWILES